MKAGENKKAIAFLAVVIVVGIIIVYFAMLLYREEYFDSVNTILSFSFNILSLLISVIALFLALFTYLSIDSANMISSMEGNVLCNENYNAEYASLVDEFSDCSDASMLEEALFEKISKSLNERSSTCMQFTDCIQEILDCILWYAYTDTKTEKYKEHTAAIIEQLDRSYKNFNAISNGNQYILSEHIKLIKNVLKYQSVTHKGEKPDSSREMLNIRGRMFQNAVSKTIYYDYLGLEFHKKATGFLRSAVGFEGMEFLQENLLKIRDHDFSSEQMKELSLYLSKAKEALKKAEESSANDVLWKGYITFNKARLDILEAVINKDFGPDWDKSIKEAIEARYGVMKIFAPKGEKSFIHEEFEKEYYYAEAVYVSMQTFLGGDKNDVRKKAFDILEKIPKDLENNAEIYSRVKLYLDDVLETVGKEV